MKEIIFHKDQSKYLAAINLEGTGGRELELEVLIPVEVGTVAAVAEIGSQETYLT